MSPGLGGQHTALRALDPGEAASALYIRDKAFDSFRAKLHDLAASSRTERKLEGGRNAPGVLRPRRGRPTPPKCPARISSVAAGARPMPLPPNARSPI